MNILSKYQDAVVMLAIVGFACKMIMAVAWSSDEKSAVCAWTRKYVASGKVSQRNLFTLTIQLKIPRTCVSEIRK